LSARSGLLARLLDGSGVVVDVRADERIQPADAEAFAATARACAGAGWAYRRVGGLDAVLVANVCWLSRYQHPRCAGAGEVAGRLGEAFAEPGHAGAAGPQRVGGGGERPAGGGRLGSAIGCGLTAGAHGGRGVGTTVRLADTGGGIIEERLVGLLASDGLRWSAPPPAHRCRR
jgi:hypothetical protein